jgi:chromosome segregation ATPase
VLRQQQRAEDFRIQIQSSQSLSRAKEEEHFAALAAKDDELVGLRSQICSYESLLKEQQSEISELNSARNAAQSKCQALQSQLVTLETSVSNISDALQSQMSANARSVAEVRELRTALETQTSTQREHYENELRHSRHSCASLQSQLHAAQQLSAASAALCSNQQQSIDDLTKQLEAVSSEKAAMAMEVDLFRTLAHKHEAAHASLSQQSQTQISSLSVEVQQSRAKAGELQSALCDASARCHEFSCALSKATADLEFKEAELKAAVKQARTKSQQQEDIHSQLHNQVLLLQHELSETSARFQQQLLASEQNVLSKASRIAALEDALAGNCIDIAAFCNFVFAFSAARSYSGSSNHDLPSSEQVEHSQRRKCSVMFAGFVLVPRFRVFSSGQSFSRQRADLQTAV